MPPSRVKINYFHQIPLDYPDQWAGIKDFQWCWLEKDIAGNYTPYRVYYRLTFDSKNLLFEVRVPKALNEHPNAAEAQFVEGLWNYDVGELFLCDSHSSRYLEINLGPRGAWWACPFEKYRNREIVSPPPLLNVKTFSLVKTDEWRSAIHIPFASLPFVIDPLKDLRANVTFILHSGKPHYYSECALVSKEPDFHLSDQFTRVNYS